MKQGKPKQATMLKGIVSLNPTQMIMKQGSLKARKAVSSNKKTSQPTKAKGK